MRLETIPLDDITPPERSDKLHPYENEDDEDWETFRNSVGTEPQKPLEVTQNGSGYELIDGDRRYRALTENEAKTARCFVVEEGDDLEGESEAELETEKTLRMVTANEYREDSDPEQRARATAKICAPWLLPPGERITDERTLSQNKMAKKVGRSQPRMSVWLNPLRDKYPLRDALADKASGNYPDADAVRTIDETIELLKSGGEVGNKVVPSSQEIFVANELADMEGVNLAEIRNVAEKAATEGWNESRLLKHLNDHYAYDEIKRVEDELDANPEFESGMMDGSDLDFEDTTDSDPEEQEFDVDEDDDEPRLPDLRSEMRGVDTEELAEHIDLSAGDLKARKMLSVSIEDEAVQVVITLMTKYGLSQREVMERFVEPLIVDNGIAHLQDDV